MKENAPLPCIQLPMTMRPLVALGIVGYDAKVILGSLSQIYVHVGERGSKTVDEIERDSIPLDEVIRDIVIKTLEAQKQTESIHIH